MSRRNKLAVVADTNAITEIAPDVSELLAELASDDIAETMYPPVPEGWCVIDGGLHAVAEPEAVAEPMEPVGLEAVESVESVTELEEAPALEPEAEPEAEPETEVVADPVLLLPVVAPAPRIRITLPDGASPETVQAGVAAALATGYGVDLINAAGDMLLTIAPPVTMAKAGKPVLALRAGRAMRVARVIEAKPESARAAGTRAMVAALAVPGGATLAELAATAGWDNIPNAFHLRRALTPLGLILGYDEKIMPRFRKYWSSAELAAEAVTA